MHLSFNYILFMIHKLVSELILRHHSPLKVMACFLDYGHWGNIQHNSRSGGQPGAVLSVLSSQVSLALDSSTPKEWNIEWILPSPQSGIELWTYIVVVRCAAHYFTEFTQTVSQFLMHWRNCSAVENLKIPIFYYRKIHHT